MVDTGELTWETIKRYHREHSKAVLAVQVGIAQPKGEVKTKRLPKGAASSWKSTTHGIRILLTVSTCWHTMIGIGSRPFRLQLYP